MKGKVMNQLNYGSILDTYEGSAATIRKGQMKQQGSKWHAEMIFAQIIAQD